MCIYSWVFHTIHMCGRSSFELDDLTQKKCSHTHNYTNNVITKIQTKDKSLPSIDLFECDSFHFDEFHIEILRRIYLLEWFEDIFIDVF